MTDLKKLAVDIATAEGRTVLKDLVSGSDFGEPVIRFTETSETFDLTIIGKDVGSSADFETKFYSKYWRGTLVLRQTDTAFGSDVLTVRIVVNHNYDVHRPTDEFEAQLGTVSLVIDSGSIALTPQPDGTPSASARSQARAAHASGHSDIYQGVLNAKVREDTVTGNEILSWELNVKAQHVNQPKLALLDGSFGSFRLDDLSSIGATMVLVPLRALMA